ncbi:Co2+/Mg2+ efflux protein ApaG [uncultured Thalassospira sp.]|jgi:ApaG protein|uniref:Co2+/Mg2+ efflux protein ApaG n=1 Tax=uncultured Thalassospira sp. TaxID=404382 RepID=UPI0030DB1F95|tara:strand:+ start:7723 stop:8115 length:393 start_codon:yes stop_codon:yes gene_type:complete
MYKAVTQNISVSVKPSFLDEQSDPDRHRYVWAYRVLIENQGENAVKLLRRHWRITDSRGDTQTVDGDGVIGEQPVIAAGESFSYTSGAPLATPGGFMVGHYVMADPDGNEFNIDVPAFSLDSPHSIATLN